MQKGHKQGTFRAEYTNGVLAETGDYYKSLKYGEWKSYYPSGELKFEGQFEKNTSYLDGAGLRSGVHAWYYESGLPEKKEVYKIELYPSANSSRDNLKRSVREGNWQTFFENGNRKEETIYLNNKPNGAHRTYYESGILKTEGEYTNDFKSGTWQTFYENTQKMIETQYTDTAITSAYYLSDGSLAAREIRESYGEIIALYLITPKGEKDVGTTYTIREKNGKLVIGNFFFVEDLEKQLQKFK